LNEFFFVFFSTNSLEASMDKRELLLLIEAQVFEINVLIPTANM